MRLLNAHSLVLESFQDERSAPPYAILSHTWGEREVSIDDIGGPRFTEDATSQGVWKILKCAEQARKEALDWIWVDTCCIQKSSSAELSEAINSMFRWYKKSAVCYAFLNDVPPRPDAPPDGRNAMLDSQWEGEFAASRWFTRGWTLQELIAPEYLVFFSADWQDMGTKAELEKLLFRITDIPRDSLLLGDTFGESIARRMSWAAKRQTTRVEDVAYCLLGIFNIYMPLLYGEGERAFQRLQEEIIKMTDDETIFAWRADSHTHATWRSLFAKSPLEFERSGDYVPITKIHSSQTHTITNKGLRVLFPLKKSEDSEIGWSSGTEFTAILKCYDSSNSGTFLKQDPIGILVKKIINEEFVRVDPGHLAPLTKERYPLTTYKSSTIAVRQIVEYSPYHHLHKCFRISGIRLQNTLEDFEIRNVQPETQWNAEKRLLSFKSERLRRGLLQHMTCVLELASATATYEIMYNPQHVYHGGCCDWRLLRGEPCAVVESFVRVMEGDAFVIVYFKPILGCHSPRYGR